jgi:hypothetical protein
MRGGLFFSPNRKKNFSSRLGFLYLAIQTTI